MRRVKIVKVRFIASTHNQDAVAHRSFNPGEVLIVLREEDRSTFFARVEDIPAEQSGPPRHLPEYRVQSAVFDDRVMALTKWLSLS